MSEEETKSPCCITITVPTYAIGSSYESVDVVTQVLPSMDTMEVASLTGVESHDIQVTIPTYTTTTVAQTFPFSATFGVDFVEDVTKDERLVVTDVFQDTTVITIPTIGTQNISFATIAGDVNRRATIKVPTYDLKTEEEEIDWTTTINLPLVTDINTTPGQFVSNVGDCSATTLSYLSDTGATITKKVEVDVDQYQLVTEKQHVRGEVTGIDIPSCDIPILKSTGSTSIPSLSYEDSSIDIPVLKSTGDLSLYNYALGGFSPITIDGATATIPPCNFSVWQPDGSETKTITVPTYSVGTTTEEIELDINIPSCEFTSYSLEETQFTIPVHWLTSESRTISCDFKSFSLVTDYRTVPWEATWDIPKYENKPKTATIGVREPQFERVTIPECETIYRSYYEDKAVSIQGDIDVDFGTLDHKIVVPEVKCKTITICRYLTRDHRHQFTVYKPTYKTKSVEVPIEGKIEGEGYDLKIPKVTVRTKTIVCKGQEIIVPGCEFSTHSLSWTSSLVSLRSHEQPYYSKSSEETRPLTPCTPGGYSIQPPSPTWTNTGRAKIQIEVVFRDGVAKYLEDQLTGPAAGGWFLDNPEKQLCLRIRDYKTGDILREIDNTVEWWSWVTARDGENVHNDPYPPYGNITDGDPRYGQNKIYMVKGNMRAERCHQIENISYVDTPKQGGHLTEVVKSSSSY